MTTSASVKYTERARRVREAMRPHLDASLGNMLSIQTNALDGLFRQLVLEDAGTAGDQELRGLTVALRAQAQFRTL